MAGLEQSQQESAVLVLGGTGKVASRVASRLKSANIPSLVASRSGWAPEGHLGVKFDWLDKATWKKSLSVVPTVPAVFIVVQGFVDPSAMVKEFIDLAREHGVERFVLLSQSPVDENGPAFGRIHRYLLELGKKGNIGWAVLRPTWFQRALVTDPKDMGGLLNALLIYLKKTSPS
jgi:festuclavine dehydrogenase